MPDQEWVKTLEDGRKVKFMYQELPEDGAFVTTQVGGNEVVYSVVLTKARNPLSHEDVESHLRANFKEVVQLIPASPPLPLSNRAPLGGQCRAFAYIPRQLFRPSFSLCPT